MNIEKAVNWAGEKEVVHGVSETAFEPHRHITREEWAVMLCNYLDSVIQKTYIEIDEEGSEAAAVTAAIESKTTAVPKPEQIVDFTADRPFYFAIRDNRSGRTLFVGQYNKAE